MPRQGPRRPPPFPSQDGASVSTATTEVPELHPSPAPFRNSHRMGLEADVGFAAGQDDEHYDDDEDDEDDDDIVGEGGDLDDDEDAERGDEEDEDMDDDGLNNDKYTSTPLPSNLREISSLASWTVSTHKPGCGISALRHPSPSQYWQSDGPQPHTLTLHFFKRVAIVRIRVYLDFELDESYTPTKMVFLAGMGGNDLVEFATWVGESPMGWVDVCLEGVGGRQSGGVEGRRRRKKKKKIMIMKRQKQLARTLGSNNSRGKARARDFEAESLDEVDFDAIHNETILDDDDDSDDDDDDDDDPSSGNILKAMVVQMKISENHQNGKDTHVRGFQVFSRDDRRLNRGSRRNSARKSIRGGTTAAGAGGSGQLSSDVHAAAAGSGSAVDIDPAAEEGRFEISDWMREPEIR